MAKAWVWRKIAEVEKSILSMVIILNGPDKRIEKSVYSIASENCTALSRGAVPQLDI